MISDKRKRRFRGESTLALVVAEKIGRGEDDEDQDQDLDGQACKGRALHHQGLVDCG